MSSILPVVAVVGTCKNAGKTTTLNVLASQERRGGRRMVLASVGRDGEHHDLLGGHDKPPVSVAPGDLVVASEHDLRHATAQLARLSTLGHRTVLGEVGLFEVRSVGSVVLSGLRFARDLLTLTSLAKRHRAEVVLIDGGLDRIAVAASELVSDVVLASGRAAGSSAAAGRCAADTVRRLDLLRPGVRSRIRFVTANPWGPPAADIDVVSAVRAALRGVLPGVPVVDAVVQSDLVTLQREAS